MATLWQDLRYGVRMLVKNRGFTTIALVTLAVGIGANTIMFSLVDVLVLRPPQRVQGADRLVMCQAQNAHGDFPYAAYLEMRDDNPVFGDMMACDEGFNVVTITPPDHAMNTRRAMAMYVSANYFSFLGAAPVYGRGFLPEEERYGAEPVVVLSHATWQRQGGNPNAIGAQLAINGTLFRIVGVAPKGFTGTTVIGPDLWLPLGTHGLIAWQNLERPPGRRWDYPGVIPVGRLQAGMAMTVAEARLRPLTARLRESHPKWWARKGVLRLSRLPRLVMSSQVNDGAFWSGAGLFLMSVSGVVLLIACLNLANMAIVQGTARHREIAIRMAIGGGRLRIMRQLLVESLVLVALGGVCGLVLAFWGTRALNAWIGAVQFPMCLADSATVGIDLRVLLATGGFCLVATVLSGVRPALRLSKRDVVGDLKESAGGALRSARRARGPRGFSVMLQIALSVVLVMGAALFARGAAQAFRPNPGYRFDGKLLIEIDTVTGGYDLARAQQIYETLAERLQSMPEIEQVALSASFPFAESGHSAWTVREYVPGLEYEEPDQEEWLSRAAAYAPTVYEVGADYFEAMDMPLLQGRFFRHLDSVPDAEKVIIIDEQVARKLWPEGNALGCLVEYGRQRSAPSRVIGIVPNLRIATDNEVGPTQIYTPMSNDSQPVFLHLRLAHAARGSEAMLLQRIRDEIRRVDPHLPVVSVTTLAEKHRSNPFVWLAGVGGRLAATFGAMALFLASLGIYAVKGYMVASRTPEIGIRKALGATHWDIMRMVFREGLVLTVAGLVLGLAVGLGVARLIANLLYGVEPVDLVSIAVTVVLLGAASLLAGYFPARRAARVDPMVALRCE